MTAQYRVRSRDGLRYILLSIDVRLQFPGKQVYEGDYFWIVAHAKATRVCNVVNERISLALFDDSV